MQQIAPLEKLEFTEVTLVPIAPSKKKSKRFLLRETIPEGKGRITKDEYLAAVIRGQESGMKSMLRLINKHHGAECCIVGGGPSLQKTVGELRRLAKRGCIIIAVNKSHDWLLKRGLPCHYAVLLDPKEWVAEYIDLTLPDRARKSCGKLWVRPTYLIASQVHEKTLAKFKDLPNAYLWHAGAGLGESELLKTRYPAGAEWCVVPGASVVGLRAMWLAHGLGCRKLRLFGIDGSAAVPNQAEARTIYTALRDAKMVLDGNPTYGAVLNMLYEIARRNLKMPEAVSAILKKHHYAYDKPHIDPTWRGFTVSLKTGWSRQFMANHHMARAVYEFEDAMKDWDKMIQAGKVEPFRVRVHGDPAVSAIAMVAAGMGVHADESENERYGKPPKKEAAYAA